MPFWPHRFPRGFFNRRRDKATSRVIKEGEKHVLLIKSRPSTIEVNDADCCAVRFGFKCRRRHGDVCKCIVPLRHGGTLNSRRAASPLVRLVEEEERLNLAIPRGFFLKSEMEPSEIVFSPVWCSKLRLTTEYNYPLATMNFVDFGLILLSIKWHK
ncbi:hypothetical protein TNCV_2033441 [Trichonephila clavipes]|nr:hypothetical protein TNCV_2033441 [Trichonephila clavipes]